MNQELLASHPAQPLAIAARVTTDGASAARIVDAVFEAHDSAETVAGAFEDASGQWTVAIHFRVSPNRTAVRALVALAAGAEAANALIFETVAERDWVRASLEALPPVAVGRFTVHGRHNRDQVPANRIGVEIEAALAFGTGHHGTTRGCLAALGGIVKRQRPRRAFRVLDIGTGSGVLAIAVAKAMHRPVLATEVDPRAVDVARANARLNKAAAVMEILRADGLAGRRIRAGAPYNLVLANILLGPLKRLATPMARLLAPNAKVVLSGLLPAQANAALAAYSMHGLALERRMTLEGWVTLVLSRARRPKSIAPPRQ